MIHLALSPEGEEVPCFQNFRISHIGECECLEKDQKYLKTCLGKNVFVQVRKANLHQSKQTYQGTSGHVLECFQWQIFPPCLALSFPSFQCVTDMRGSRNFFQGGSMPDGQKTICSMFSFQRNLYFSKDPEGVQQYPGGPTFSRGDPNASFYRNPYNL